MATVTNVSRRLIHAGDTMLIPGVPAELSDEMMGNAVIKRYLKIGDIREGEVEVQPEVPQDEDEAEPKPRAQQAPAKPAQAPAGAHKPASGKE